MGKNKDICELTNILAKALRHRIGAIVNSDELYAQKYARDADILFFVIPRGLATGIKR